MKFLKNIFWFIGAVAALCALGIGVYSYFEKKKEDKDLEHYLDCAIQ